MFAAAEKQMAEPAAGETIAVMHVKKIMEILHLNFLQTKHQKQSKIS